MRRNLALVILILGGSEALAAPVIKRIAPLALKPGQETILTFGGSSLESATNLWTSCGAQSRRIEGGAGDAIRFLVTCPSEARGVQALQLSGPNGASDFRLIFVDDLPVAENSEARTDREKTEPFQVPAAVDAFCRSEQTDYYRFSGRAGELLSIEVLAHRIGSEMDPVVQVLDSSGHELAFCDDEPGVWRDARFSFRPPLDGGYTLAVHDAAFGGGENFFYRLRVSRDPLVWFTFPLSDPLETSVPTVLIGTNVRRSPLGSPANPPAPFLLGATPALAEFEPNDDPDHAQKISWPAVIHGKLETGRDTDLFLFAVLAKDKLIFTSRTRSLGSPCDLVLELLNKDGNSVAHNDPARGTDAALTNYFPESGEFFLRVRELSGTSPENAPYRIDVKRSFPSITASVEDNTLEVKPGGVVSLKIHLDRFDYGGPVQLTLEPPIPGLSLVDGHIPEKAKDFELKILAGEGLAPGVLEHFHLRAQGEGCTALVSTMPALRKGFPLMLNPPSCLEGIVSLCVRAE